MEGGEGAEIQPAAADAQVLEWLPPTVAAVSLRLGALDAALIYSPGLPPARDTLQVKFVPSALHACLLGYWYILCPQMYSTRPLGQPDL